MKTRNSTILKYFPDVKTVKDAKKPIQVEVSPQDVKLSKRSKHKECAMAVACKRKMKLDGILIARSTAYLIKGSTAIRFKVPNSLEREITSFDRGAAFDPGVYGLSVPQRTQQRNDVGGHRPHKNRGSQGVYHMTRGIRAVLGGKDAQV
jgi:hypothetical protein